MSNKLLILSFVLLFLIGCSKERPAQLTEVQQETYFAISSLEHIEALCKLETPSKEQLALNTEETFVRADSEVVRLKVVATEIGDGRLQSMFKDLWVDGRPGETFKVVFKVNKKYVIAFKKIAIKDSFKLTDHESALAVEKDGFLLVPIFQYPVDSVGTINITKNDLGENTNRYEFKRSDFDVATHLEMSVLSSNRLKVGLYSKNDQERERIFLTKRLDGKTFKGKDFKKNLNMQLDIPNGLVYSELTADSKLNVYKVVSKDELGITQLEALINSDATGIAHPDVRYCPASVAKMFEGSDCVLAKAIILSIDYVSPKPMVDVDGTESWDIEFTSADSGKAKLVRIAQDAPKERVDVIHSYNPKNVLIAKNFKNKEFLFRRTLIDSPNYFEYSFAGSSGNLLIVKFSFSEDAVNIERARPLLSLDGVTDVDNEVIMSVPAQYMKEIKRDGAGNLLARPKLVQTSYKDENAIVFVDWTQNRIPTTHSPINYYGVEQCFGGKSDQVIDQVNLDPNNGLYAFTLTSTYVNGRGDLCGMIDSDYFSDSQSTFTFKERVAFKEFIAESNDEQPMFDIPYKTQKRLGFGIFTYTKQKPNQYGNTGREGSVVALPSIFDLRDRSKQITYVLAGIPTEKENADLRDKLIWGVKKTVEDLNAGFKQAFADTSMSRDIDVIRLQVENLSAEESKKYDLANSPKRVMGDLDRNYIYYVSKATSSGVLGLGGAHHNPRTGKVESASVYIYGGNMYSSIESMRRVAKIREEYRNNMKLDQADVLPNVSTEGEASPANLLKTNSQKIATPTPFAMKTMSADLSMLTKESVKQSVLRSAKSTQLISSDEIYSRSIQGSKSSRDFEATFQKLVKNGELQDPSMVAAAFDPNSKNLVYLKNVVNKMEQNNISVEMVNPIAMASRVDSSIDNLSDNELFIKMFIPTLAHEVLHNFGLRHNFQGSFDKANYKFKKLDENGVEIEIPSIRNYSSLMDYQPGLHDTYDGLGPNDVYMLRAAYTGLLEKRDRTFVHVDKVLDIAGLNSWLDVDSGALKKLDLRPFMFCSDEDAGLSPSCNRFDLGTNPAEIVDIIIQDYKELYALTNFRGDRLNFTRDSGNYIGYLFSNFLRARQFLEETFYQAIYLQASQETIIEYATAAYKAYSFFQEVVRTPDASSKVAMDPAARFTELNLGEGKTAVVEQKLLGNIAHDDVNDNDLKIRGIEYDKIVALIALSERSFGFQRYEDRSLKLSFYLFEKYILGITDPAKSLMVQLLTEILKDDVIPVAMTKYGPISLDSLFSAKMNESMRFRAALASMVSLDMKGSVIQDNPSTMFRVLRDFKAPDDGVHILEPGSGRYDLKYWAMDTAIGSIDLVNSVHGIDAVLAVKDKLIEAFSQWFILKIQAEMPGEDENGNSVVDPQIAAALKLATDQLTTILTALPATSGMRDLDKIFSEMTEVLSIASQLQPYAELPQYADVLAEQLQSVKMQSQKSAQRMPILGVALASISGKDFNIDLVDMIRPDLGVMTSQKSTIFDSISQLSSFFYLVHPEYN